MTVHKILTMEGGGRVRRLSVLVLVVAAAGCGGGNGDRATADTTFSDQVAFEAYVAGYLQVASVDCRKLSATRAECDDGAGSTYAVMCASADESGGRDCAIVRKAERR